MYYIYIYIYVYVYMYVTEPKIMFLVCFNKKQLLYSFWLLANE